MTFTHKELRKFNSDARKLIMKVQEAGWRGDRIARHGAVLLAPDDQPFRICVPRNVNGRLLNNTMAPFKRWMIQQGPPSYATTTEEVQMPACTECGKTFQRKQQVMVHHAMVHDLKQCPSCERKMNASNLARHIASAHKPFPEPEPVDTEAPLTLAGIEIVDTPEIPDLIDYFREGAGDDNSRRMSVTEQVIQVRAIVAPELYREINAAKARITELERMIVDQQEVHRKEMEECSAKLDLIRGLVDSR